MPKPRRRFIFKSICQQLVAVLVLSAACHGQVRPPPLGQDITNATELTPEKLAIIKAYVDAWVAVMNNSDARPEEVEAARGELQRPLGAPGVTGIFRFEYSKILVPQLEPVVAANNFHTAVNALILASSLGTDRAANFLLAHVSEDDQKQWQIRLRAASGCETLMKGEGLDVRTIKNGANILRAAALQERNPLVLRRHLDAIDAADHNRLEEKFREELHGVLIDTIQLLTDRMTGVAGADREAMLVAVNGAITTFRDKYLGNAVKTAERRTVGQKLSPILAKLLSIAAADWETGHSNPESSKTYSAMIGAWEGFLSGVDLSVRGGQALQTNLRSAWNAGDKAKFDADLAQWMTIVQGPPYK